jgi:hypothetical protein
MCIEGTGYKPAPSIQFPSSKIKGIGVPAHQFGKFLEIIKVIKFSYDNH